MSTLPLDLWDRKYKTHQLSIHGLIAYNKAKYDQYRKLYLKGLYPLKKIQPLLRVHETLDQLGSVNDFQRSHAVYGMVEDLKEYKETWVIALVDHTKKIYISCKKDQQGASSLVKGVFVGFILNLVPKEKDKISENSLEEFVSLQSSRARYYVKKIVYPPKIFRPKRPPLNSGVVLVGDIHVGAHTHLELDFLNFIEWVNSQRDLGYMILAGDSLDGRNVYPSHDKGLKIKSIQMQAHALGKSLAALRKDIQLIMIMGNHECVGTRREPHIWPSALKDILNYYNKNILFVSNPGYVRIGQYNFLLYHGASADPLIARCSALSYEDPTTVNELLVKYRNLCPVSDKIPLMPTPHLYHLIPEDTDYLITGHIHRQGRKLLQGGLQVVSCGTWQHITPFQARLGFKPHYAVADVVYPGSPEKDKTLSFKSNNTDLFRHEKVL